MEIKITTDNFQKEVLESKELVLIDFFADWCGPCKSLAPVLEKKEKEGQGKWTVLKVYVDLP